MPDKDTRSTIASHEPASLRDGTASLEAGNKSATREDALEDGRQTAKNNLKQERRENGRVTAPNRDEILDDARDTAQLNRKAEEASQPEGTNSILKNDTSKAAKVRTAKAQLDPTGEDPISTAEIERSATNASMETGNQTAVSNEDAAERAENPGRAEEESSASIAGEGTDHDGVEDDVAYANKNQKVDKS